MDTKELYINEQLVDLPGNFSVRLNRQLLNPGELNTKDAQFSYTIELAATDRTHAALGYANIEETRDKFNKLYTAELIINGVQVFSGLFKLTSIGDGYKGNLYIPAQRTVKDIFGDIALNAIPEWRIQFSDFANSISAINNAAKLAPQPAIFPFALYGLLPKVPLNRDANSYSARTLWDDSVYIGMADVPPSLNLLKTLRHIFESQGFALQGTAFDDVKLAGIYMSYKNSPEYIQPWNYGYHARIQVGGEWSAAANIRTGAFSLEKGVNQSYDANFNVFSTDLLDSVNSAITVAEDTGGNVLYKEIQDAQGAVWAQGQIRIPASGFYKVRLNGSVAVDQRNNTRWYSEETGLEYFAGQSSEATNDFNNGMHEIKLLRDRRQANFGLTSAKIDGRFYYDNLPQNAIFDAENVPKYFPRIVEGSQKVMVDLAQNKNIVLGLHFGNSGIGGRVERTDFVNPRDSSQLAPMVLAAKPSVSWNAQETSERTLLAIPNPGYWRYGRTNVFGDDENNPTITVSYASGTRVTGKVLDGNGNPADPSDNNLSQRFANLNFDSTSGLIRPATGWEVTDFIDLSTFTDIRFSAEVPAAAQTAVVVYSDQYRRYLGYEILADPSSATSFANYVIDPPLTARYVQFAGASGTVQVTGDDIVLDNVILVRFPLEQYFTYILTAAPGVTGRVYLHNGADPVPITVTEFNSQGVARIDITATLTENFEPRLSLYLKTAAYDIDGSMTLTRNITESSDETIDWVATNRFGQSVINAPASYAVRGQFDGQAGNAMWDGQGEANAVVWFDAGELLTVAAVSAEGRYRRSGTHSSNGVVNSRVKWSLSVQPFRVNKDWATIALNGDGAGVMDWNDPVNFDTDSINLMGFMSADIKTNDFIDNVVRAFNLNLTQINADTFELNVKQRRNSVSSRAIDIDGFTALKERTNTPLGLPSVYRIGFTVDKEEQGFIETQDDGGGEFNTGTVDGNVVEQKTTFSYNWFKNMTKEGVQLPLPIITKADIWSGGMTYPEAMAKRYTDLAYRFWYFDGLLNDLGVSFDFNDVDMALAKVTNEMPGISTLNYKNQPRTILDNYFTLLINGSSHYTEIEGYITPEQYRQFDGSILARFNSDLYYTAEISGYDPEGRNKTKLKLIRLI